LRQTDNVDSSGQESGHNRWLSGGRPQRAGLERRIGPARQDEIPARHMDEPHTNPKRERGRGERLGSRPCALACASGVRRGKVWQFLWVRDPCLEEVDRQEQSEVGRERRTAESPRCQRAALGSSASQRAIRE